MANVLAIGKRVLFFTPLVIPILIFCGRVLIPDYSYDSLNYHLVGSLQVLRSLVRPYASQEFFPNGLQTYAPVFELPSFIARKLLGYRLGSCISLISTVTACVLAVGLLKQALKNTSRKPLPVWAQSGLAFVGLLLCSATNDSLFQLATYFVDNFNSVLQLSLIILLNKIVDTPRNSQKIYLLSVVAGILMGVMCYGKMTNIGFVIPCAGIFLLTEWITRRKFPTHFIAAGVLAALTMAPYFHFLYIESGNPVAPFFGTIFRSDFFKPYTFAFNFGATNWRDRVFYPWTAIRDPKLVGEGQLIFPDIRMSIIFFLNVFMLIILGTVSRFKQIPPVVFRYTILFFGLYYPWALQFGYGRYGIAIEYLGIILWVVLAAALLGRAKIVGGIAVTTGFVILGYNSLLTLKFNSICDMSWRPPLWNSASVHKEQLPFLWSSKQSVSDEIRTKLRQSDIIYNCRPGTIGLSVLFPDLRNKPIVLGKVQQWYFMVSEQFGAAQVKRLPKKDMYKFVVVLPEGSEVKDCLASLPTAGAIVDSVHHFDSILGYTSTNGMSTIFGRLARKDIL